MPTINGLSGLPLSPSLAEPDAYERAVTYLIQQGIRPSPEAIQARLEGLSVPAPGAEISAPATVQYRPMPGAAFIPPPAAPDAHQLAAAQMEAIAREAAESTERLRGAVTLQLSAYAENLGRFARERALSPDELAVASALLNRLATTPELSELQSLPTAQTLRGLLNDAARVPAETVEPAGLTFAPQTGAGPRPQESVKVTQQPADEWLSQQPVAYQSAPAPAKDTVEPAGLTFVPPPQASSRADATSTVRVTQQPADEWLSQEPVAYQLPPNPKEVAPARKTAATNWFDGGRSSGGDRREPAPLVAPLVKDVPQPVRSPIRFFGRGGPDVPLVAFESATPAPAVAKTVERNFDGPVNFDPVDPVDGTLVRPAPKEDPVDGHILQPGADELDGSLLSSRKK